MPSVRYSPEAIEGCFVAESLLFEQIEAEEKTSGRFHLPRDDAPPLRVYNGLCVVWFIRAIHIRQA